MTRPSSSRRQSAGPAVEDVSMPSTMRYKDRLELNSLDPNAYSRLYSTSASGPVWDRLTTDAGMRSLRSSRSAQYQEGINARCASGSNSGFLSNTHVAVNTSAYSFKSGRLQDGPALDDLNVLTLHSYKKNHPTNFSVAFRPDAETTNQTNRMLGTYADDKYMTERMGIFVAAGCPGGKGHWHPDVLPLRSGTAPQGLTLH